MHDHILMYLFYGLVAGFSELTPVSASAHRVLFPTLFGFDSTRPLLQLFVHGGVLGALFLLYWQRLSHIYREMQMLKLRPSRRKRPPDTGALMDGRLVQTALAPALVGVVLSAFVGKGGFGLLSMAILLILGGIAIYLPDYRPGGDRQTGSMSRLDGLLLGFCTVLGVLPGLSRGGLMLSLGLLRKCDRSYLLDMVMLISVPVLAGMMAVDFLSIFFAGFAGYSAKYLLGCLLAGAASFGGGIAAIFMMRFLAVKTGFSGFAYYGWGLGLFSFILYLMV